MRLLEVVGLSKRFGGLQAVSDLSLAMERGEVLGLIGPNGAGKTTAFNLISGFLTPDAGDVRFQGRSIVGWKPHAICRAGLTRTFQIVRPFPHLSVLGNVKVGALARHPAVAEAVARARAVIAQVGLAAKADVPAAGLTLAERKRLELARALATEPVLLLLDEVMAGLTDTELAASVRIVRGVRDAFGTTILWVEHVMSAVIELAERAIVLNFGKVLAEGTPEVVMRNAEVIDAYLGEADSA